MTYENYTPPKSLKLEDGTCRGLMHLMEKDNLPCLLDGEWQGDSCKTCYVRQLYMRHLVAHNSELIPAIKRAES